MALISTTATPCSAARNTGLCHASKSHRHDPPPAIDRHRRRALMHLPMDQQMAMIALFGASFAVALLCAAVMGYAIQRGATCMVMAVEEIVTQQRFSQAAAMLEAGLWVAGGLLLARALGHLQMAPASYPIGIGTMLGGAVLGLGALVNRSCVFGSIAKLGSGKWAYAVTPLGYFGGCLLAGRWIAHPHATGATSRLFDAGLLMAVPLAAYTLWRGRAALRTLRQRRARHTIWAPHQATMVIGVMFVVMLLTVGNWAYTQMLADAAMGMVAGLTLKLILFGGLLGGAIFGGWTAGLIHPVWPAPHDLARCLLGGAMMGAGSLLIPGTNDGLILLGLPLILPYALVALASMACAIVAGMLIERRWLSS